MKKVRQFLAVIIGGFCAYNILMYFVFTLDNQSLPFLTAWGATSLSFIIYIVFLIVCNARLKSSKIDTTGYRKAESYMISIFVFTVPDLAALTVFALLDEPVDWRYAALLYFVLLLAFILTILIINQKAPKQCEESVSVDDKIKFIRLLYADAQMLYKKAEDKKFKEKCRKFAESVRFSDPISEEALFELEKELTATVFDCSNAIDMKNIEKADELCDRAILLLTERNEKCKALKHRL